MHDGASIEGAERQADITVNHGHRALLRDIAVAIGTALGRLSSLVESTTTHATAFAGIVIVRS